MYIFPSGRRHKSSASDHRSCQANRVEDMRDEDVLQERLLVTNEWLTWWIWLVSRSHTHVYNIYIYIILYIYICIFIYLCEYILLSLSLSVSVSVYKRTSKEPRTGEVGSYWFYPDFSEPGQGRRHGRSTSRTWTRTGPSWRSFSWSPTSWWWCSCP